MPCSEKRFSKIGPLLICLIIFSGFLPRNSMAVAEDLSAPVKEITVAVGQDTAPFYFRDAKGAADGWLVDLWQLWSQKSGIKVKFVQAPFGETLKLTKEGKVDVQGGCFFSEARAKYLGYVAPLIKADTHFFFHKDIYGIKTLKDLLGFRIGVIKGDFAVEYLRNNLPGAAIAEYVNNGDLFKAAKKGEIRVFVIDTPVGLYFLKKLRLLSNFRYFPDKPLYTNAFQVR
jgi:ABC-type amino acid transport substrate-binding protein